MYLTEVPPAGTAIQKAGDLLVALIEQEREQAAQNVEARFSHLAQSMEEHKSNCEANKIIYESNSALYKKRIQELECRVIELQSLGRTSVAAAHEFPNILEHTRQAQDVLCSRSDVPSCIPQTLPSRLAEYGIYLDNADSPLSFRGKWLPLWEELVYSDTLGSNIFSPESIGPAGLNSFLSIFVDRLRRDRQTIESLTQTMLTLRQECQCMSMSDADQVGLITEPTGEQIPTGNPYSLTKSESSNEAFLLGYNMVFGAN